MSDLPDFEGFEVSHVAVRITKAGDGLSPALKVRRVAHHPGQEVCFILRTKVAQINHKGDPDDDGLTRVETLDTTGITEIDNETANRHLNNAAEDLARAQQAAADADQQRLIDEEQAAEDEGD